MEVGRVRVVLVVSASAVWAAASAGGQVSFTNVASAAGLTTLHSASHAHGMGAAWIDFNRDGWPDLFIVNGKGKAEHLYQNDGDGTFTLVGQYLPALPDVEMMGSVFADYDNDGDSDLYIFTDNENLNLFDPANPQDGPENLLLRNLWVENGGTYSTPLFVEVAAAAGVDNRAIPPWGPTYEGWRSASGGWLDYDRDGWVDLFISNWVTGHQGEPANQDHLYRNLGDGTFADVSTASGIASDDPLGYRAGLAAIGAHLDGDLWPDLYVGNVLGDPPLHFDDLWLNNRNGTFTESSGLSPGLGDDSAAAMGFAVGDIENDGDWDLFETDIYQIPDSAPPPGDALYLGNGDGTFSDNVADLVGVAGPGPIANHWGANFFDADQDGDEDLFVGAAYGSNQGFSNRFYLNNGDGTFTDLTGSTGLETSNSSRGSALADYDRDGDLDLIVVPTGSAQGRPLLLYRNDTVNGNGWLQLALAGGPGSNRDAIGTVVKARVGEAQMMRQVTGGASAHSQDALAVHFGLGPAARADTVQILWPSGQTEVHDGLAVNQRLSLVERDLPALRFEDVTLSAGLDFTHALLGIPSVARRISAGIAVGDYDNDGLPDLYAVAGDAGANKLYRNLGDGTFEEVAAAAGVAIAGQAGSGPRFFDHDGDGWEDLFVGGTEGLEPRLFRNEGDGTFTEVLGTGMTAAGRNSFASAFADVDRDHDLDAFVGHWGIPDVEICTTPCRGHLWLNNGDSTFTDSDVAWGLDLEEADADYTFAPNFGDLDGDGWPDLVSVNDFGTTQVWLNNGGTGVVDVTDELVITDENGMGGALGDFDKDGDLDWYVASIWGVPENAANYAKTGNRLYRNLGDGTFEDATADTGTRVGGWGWGACMGDFDNDTWMDIFQVSGWIEEGYTQGVSELYLADGDGRFTEVAQAVGIVDTAQGRGVSCFDYDRDGDLDILVSNNQDTPNLYRNDGGNTKNWVNFSLASRTRNTAGIGARVSVTANGETQIREVYGVGGFVSQSPAEAHFGLGEAATIDAVVVEWPNGIVNTYDSLAINGFGTLKQVYDSIGSYLSTTGEFNLRNVNEDGPADTVFAFGPGGTGPNWGAVAGDWNGDGIGTIGLYNGDLGKFLLRNSNDAGAADLAFKFGPVLPGVTRAVVGDWDGDGDVTIGTFRHDTKKWALRDTNSGGPGDVSFGFGLTGVDVYPLAGDWDGDGDDTVGVYDRATGEFRLKNVNGTGAADHVYVFGPIGAQMLPVAGDWDGDGVVTVGVYDTAAGVWYLRNAHAAGPEDILVTQASGGGLPIGGMWN